FEGELNFNPDALDQSKVVLKVALDSVDTGSEEIFEIVRDLNQRERVSFLLADPGMILLDEPSMGLAPQVVEEIFEIVRDLNQRERVSFLLADPGMILLDEPSMGLAPQVVEEIFEIVRDLNQRERVSFLLAEQNTNVALKNIVERLINGHDEHDGGDDQKQDSFCAQQSGSHTNTAIKYRVASEHCPDPDSEQESGNAAPHH
ncbi:ABC transporter, partial [Alcaligenes faecalis subsp. faecalis NCIB 8687]